MGRRRAAMVAGGQRATAARRMRNDRAARWPCRRALVAGRPALAGVRRETDGTQVVPSTQREHRGRLLGAPATRRSRECTRALLHERCAGSRALRARVECGAAARAGTLALLGRVVGDPRLGMAGVFLSLRHILPHSYPLTLGIDRYVADEQRLGRMLDYAVIVPRLQHLYEWSRTNSASRACENCSRRQPDLRVAVRGTTRVARPAHDIPGFGTRTRHASSVRPREIAPP